MSDTTDVQEAYQKARLHILNLIVHERDPLSLANLTHALNNLKRCFSDAV